MDMLIVATGAVTFTDVIELLLPEDKVVEEASHPIVAMASALQFSRQFW